jgi:mono/diheme cytochrome c family protein
VTHRAALATAAALLLAAALLVACGGSSSSSTSSTSTAKAKSGSGGAAVFTAAGCGGCHTLAGAHSHAMVGPNLDQLKPNTATVAKQVENGGGGMPVFRGQLHPPRSTPSPSSSHKTPATHRRVPAAAPARPGLAQRQRKHPFGCRSAPRLLIVPSELESA